MKSQVEESKKVKAKIDRLIDDFDCIEIEYCEDCYIQDYCDAYGSIEGSKSSPYKPLT